MLLLVVNAVLLLVLNTCLCSTLSIGRGANVSTPTLDTGPLLSLLLTLHPRAHLRRRHLGISSSARASAYLYNTEQEVDAFIGALEDTIKFFSEV